MLAGLAEPSWFPQHEIFVHLLSGDRFCSNPKIYFPHFPACLSYPQYWIWALMEAGQTGRRSILCYSTGKALVVCVEHKYQGVPMTLQMEPAPGPPSTLLSICRPVACWNWPRLHLRSDAGRPHASKNRASAVRQVPVCPLERGELKDFVQLLSHPFLWNSQKFADEPPGL